MDDKNIISYRFIKNISWCNGTKKVKRIPIRITLKTSWNDLKMGT